MGDGGWFDVGYVLMLLPAHFAADGVAEDGKKYAFHLLPCGMINKAGWCALPCFNPKDPSWNAPSFNFVVGIVVSQEVQWYG